MLKERCAYVCFLMMLKFKFSSLRTVLALQLTHEKSRHRRPRGNHYAGNALPTEELMVIMTGVFFAATAPESELHEVSRLISNVWM